MSKPAECVDCIAEGVTRWRPVEGVRVKRCVTHVRSKKRADKERARNNSRERRYGLSAEDYAELKAFQGGLCAICGPFTGNAGKSRDLSTDHDHSCCKEPPTCGKCTRGLLCGRCNTFIGGASDNPMIGIKLFEYLSNPPWKRLRGV